MEKLALAPGEAGAELWCQRKHRLCATHGTARQGEAPHFQVFGVDQGSQPLAGLQSFSYSICGSSQARFFFFL